jgi:transcription initiation factor TFIIH subunit 2
MQEHVCELVSGSAGANHVHRKTQGLGRRWCQSCMGSNRRAHLGVRCPRGRDTLAEAVRKRRRILERQDYAQRNRRVVRDMIRYLYIVVDASRWTRQKDPVFPGGSTVIQAITRLLVDFIQEYFDQNPVSHLGFVMAKEGEATQLHCLSGNSRALKEAVQSVAEMCGVEGPAKGGEFSLQNALEVAGRSLGHQPRHGSREVVVVTSALSTCDPGFILTETLPKLQQASIRVSCIALSAELYICRKLTEETSGVMGVCIDQQHFRDWMMAQCTPPPATSRLRESGCEMIPMGFPSRTSSDMVELVHAGRHKTILSRTGFIWYATKWWLKFANRLQVHSVRRRTPNSRLTVQFAV